MAEIPQGWVAVKLGEIANISYGKGLPTKNLKPEGFPVFGANGVIGFFDEYLFVEPQLLISCRGANSGTINFSPSRCFVTNNSLIVDFPLEQLQLRKTLFYFLMAANKERLVTGTAQPQVTINNAVELELCLPPLAEQHRIVAKIEELFSELDQGVASLKTAREQLKVYRQSLLKNAFEGKLTAAWRAAHADQLETATALQQRIARERQVRYQQQIADWQTAGQSGPKPKPPKPLPPLTAEELAELPELPAGWAWIRLGAANIEVFDGPFGSNLKSSDYVSDGVRVIRLENIGAMEFIENKLSFITSEKYQALEKHTVFPGDLVFSSFVTENVRVAMVPPSIEKAVNKADCFCIRLFGETLLNSYALSFLATRSVYKRLEEEIHGVGRPRINTTQLKNVVIPVCSTDEQRELVALVQEKLSEADQLDQTLATALQQADALRQSILKKAFHGQLEKQDKNEEPATALLERIRTEKSNGMNAPPNRRKAG